MEDKRTIRTSTTRNKARSNKVHTAKGPRDRRIRLSADIAIQFYDVQDRLGCDRASEAVDWLISKAKGSIDNLFNTEHEFQHHLTNSGAENNVVHQQNDYLTENNMSGILSKSSTTDVGFNFLQGNNDSMLFPCIQMGNSSSENHQCFQYSSMAPFQGIDEKGHVIPRMIMFDSKLNSRKNEVHPLIPNYVPLMSSSVDTSTSDPKLNLCLPGNSTSAFSDSEQWTIF